MLSGAFWINKPTELTSSDVVVRLKIALTKNEYCERGFKIGHGGTLDPFATGALVVLVGEATKLADAYLHSIKSYRGVIQLGDKTDTGDLTGTVTESIDVPAICEIEWQKFASEFVKNEYWQTPPMYSAKKLNGKNLYDLARQGIEVERQPILKKIHSFSVQLGEPKQLRFEVQCESGTYVRVLAEDLARKAGTCAYLKTLVRSQSSDVALDQCSSLEEVQLQLSNKNPTGIINAFHPMNEVATHLTSTLVDQSLADSFLMGKTQVIQNYLHEINETQQSKYVVARVTTGQPVALFERTEKKYRLQRVILT